jgi:hypothetical protein
VFEMAGQDVVRVRVCGRHTYSLVTRKMDAYSFLISSASPQVSIATTVKSEPESS